MRPRTPSAPGQICGITGLIPGIHIASKAYIKKEITGQLLDMHTGINCI